MIEARPYDDLSAMAVLSRLDPNDFIEAEVTRGAPTNHLALFAEWRSMEPIRVASFVTFTAPDRGGKPFAVFALSNTGQAGVAQAALLARDHQAFRRPLAELAVNIRYRMPLFAAERGIHRIEARSWADHPTASALLSALGFAHECDMAGFGPTGRVTFRQFAWTAPVPAAPAPAP
jgi:hypothetical protein